jgi:hypothetical protein
MPLLNRKDREGRKEDAKYTFPLLENFSIAGMDFNLHRFGSERKPANYNFGTLIGY